MDAGVPPCLDLRARTDGPGNCSGSAPAEGPGRPRSPTVSHDPGVYGLSRPYDGLGRSKTLGTYRLGNRQGVFRAPTPNHPDPSKPVPSSPSPRRPSRNPRASLRANPIRGSRRSSPSPRGEENSGDFARMKVRGLPPVRPPPATTVAELPTLGSPFFTLSKGRGRRRCTHRQSVRGLPRTQRWATQGPPVGEQLCWRAPLFTLSSPPLSHSSPLSPPPMRGLPRTHLRAMQSSPTARP